MDKRIGAGAKTSLLASPGIMALLAVLIPTAALHGFRELGAACAFLLVLALLSRLLSAAAMQALRADVETDRTALFPDETLTLRFRMKNRGVLPLWWAELALPVAADAALLPSALMEDPAQERSEDASGHLGRRFTRLSGGERLKWETVWKGAHRGIFRMTSFRLRSGDPFGLVPQERAERSAGEIAVYPRLQIVRTALFLEPNWESRSGGSGFLEDASLLRGSRDYQYGDAARRINWRMTARTEDLTVNLYERIRPRGALFVFDGESFNDLPCDETALEDALSILASVLVSLSAAGVESALALPRAEDAPPVLLSSAPLPLLLRALAAYRLQPLAAPETPDQPVRYRTSVFSPHIAAAAAEAGRVYYLCASLETVRGGAVLEKLERSGHRAILLPYYPGGEARFPAQRVVVLTSLKRGGGA